MNSERLGLLTKELRVWPSEQFFFGEWVGDDWGGMPDLSCGTTGCAVGVASTMPVFRALGLRLARTDTAENGGIGYVTIEGTDPIRMDWSDGINHFKTSLRAAMTIFDLTYTEASYLFLPEYGPYDLGYDGSVELNYSPNENASAIEVADHIDRYIQFCSCHERDFERVKVLPIKSSH